MTSNYKKIDSTVFCRSWAAVAHIRTLHASNVRAMEGTVFCLPWRHLGLLMEFDCAINLNGFQLNQPLSQKATFWKPVTLGHSFTSSQSFHGSFWKIFSQHFFDQIRCLSSCVQSSVLVPGTKEKLFGFFLSKTSWHCRKYSTKSPHCDLSRALCCRIIWTSVLFSMKQHHWPCSGILWKTIISCRFSVNMVWNRKLVSSRN